MWSKGSNSSSNWGKNNSTFGKNTNTGNTNQNQSNKNNASNKAGTGTGTTTAWGSKTGTGTTTGWGINKNQTATTGSFKAQNREPVVTPVCTIDLPISPSTVNLALKITGENIPARIDFTVNHISQMEIFNKYTIDEIRYYDYLHGGFIDKIKPTQAKTGFSFGKTGTYGTTGSTFGKTQTTSAFGQANSNQETILKYVTPFRRKPEELKPPPLATQKQPFGALPASTITFPQTEGDEPLPKQEQIPDDIGFRDNITRYEHLVTTKEEKASTPGLRQLNPQKIQIKTPKEVAPNPRPNIRSFNDSFSSFSDEKDNKENPEEQYSYMPDLDSILDDDVVYNFTVIHPDYGSIAFPDGFKVKKIDPKNKIVIRDRKIEVNVSNPMKNALGIDKNFISIVTLKNIFPSENRKQESLREYETDLRKFCDDHNLKFISYFYEDGVLMFSVPSLAYFPVEIE